MARGSSRLPDATPGQETGERIERRSLHHEVVGRLRGMILQGELQAGERIPERELCDRFGISRTCCPTAAPPSRGSAPRACARPFR